MVRRRLEVDSWQGEGQEGRYALTSVPEAQAPHQDESRQTLLFLFLFFFSAQRFSSPPAFFLSASG